MGKRGKQGWKKVKLPVGTIRLRARRPGPGRRAISVRYIKHRDDGPTSRQWIPLARWTWEKMHGPVPPGKRVVHLDGNSLNDAPSNYGLLTAGEVIKLHHRLNPAMSEENRYGIVRRAAIAEHNRLRGRLRRLANWLSSRWYPVDRGKRVIHNQAFRSRRKLLAAFCGVSIAVNGGISRRRRAALSIQAVRGRDLSKDEFLGFKKVEPDGTVYRRQRMQLGKVAALFHPERA